MVRSEIFPLAESFEAVRLAFERAVNMQWLNGGDVQISTSAPSGASRSARTRSQNGLPIEAAGPTLLR